MIDTTAQPDHTSRFDGKGALYAKARPGYAPGLLGYLQNTLRIPEGSVIADVGSGTGIFTALLLDCGYRVYAVEPNADMRKEAEKRLSGVPAFQSVNGTDRATTLPDCSMDCVTAAQAFHWFDAAAFREECERILVPGGWAVLVWNVRDEAAECTQALAELRRRYNPEFHGFSNGMNEEDVHAFFGGR